jgi:hypothetical protein
VQGSDSDGSRELGLGSDEAVGYAGRMQCFRTWGWGGGMLCAWGSVMCVVVYSGGGGDGWQAVGECLGGPPLPQL